MIFSETKLLGAFTIDIERLEDERGFFARAWCEQQFVAHNLTSNFVQCNISVSKMRGTVRGLHYQIAPHQETKLIRCTRGAIFDVIVDLRPQSATYKQWVGVDLAGENHKMLYVPKGFAHGFQTLADETEVFYPVSEFYSPEFERGVRWDDPAFAIRWPVTDQITVSDKDMSWSDYLVPDTAVRI